MMKPTKKLAISMAGIGALVFTAAAVWISQHDKGLVKVPDSVVPQERAASTVPVPASTPGEPEAPRASEAPIVTLPSLPVATTVQDADLLKLSAMVNLPNAEERRIDKEQWSRSLPIARQLVQGLCDCEQRNWLNHYIELGEDALAGSNDAYYTLAALMQKMARNDKQLTDDPSRVLR